MNTDTDYGHTIAKSPILCVPNSNKYFGFGYKDIIFCRNNGWLMENHGLGTHNDKLCADSSTGHPMKA